MSCISLTRLLLKNKKNFFFFFYPHTLTIRLKRPVYRGFGGEGKCEGRIFTLTLAITAAERCFFFLHLNGLAALRSVSLRLQSLNQKTLTEYRIFFGVFFTDLFFDFRFDSDCALQDNRDFRRILQVGGTCFS